MAGFGDNADASFSNDDNDNSKQSPSSRNGCAACCKHFLLSLRTRTVITLLLLFIIMFGLFLAVVLIVFPITYSKLEDSTTRDAGRRVTRAIFDDFSGLLKNIIVFAQWDTTYNMHAAPTDPDISAYIDSNYPPSILQSLNLNFVFHYKLDGTPLFSVTRNLIDGTVPSSLSTLTPVATHPFLVKAANATGYVATYAKVSPTLASSQLMVLVSAPITNSNADAKPNGIIVFGRYLSSSVVNDLATRAQLCVSAHNINNNNDAVSKDASSYITSSVKGIPIDLKTADWENNDAFLIQALSKGNTNPGRECWKQTTGSDPISEDRIGAFMLINDMYGQPILIVRADQSRIVQSLGNLSIGVALGAVAGVTLIISIVVLSFVECAVLRRMISLAYHVRNIGETGDVQKRVPNYMEDEVGIIATNINGMLVELQKTQTSLKEEQEKLQVLLHKISIEEQRFRSINNAINDFILTVNEQGVIIQSNTSFHDKFQFAVNKTDNVLNISRVLQPITAVAAQQPADQQPQQPATGILETLVELVQTEKTLDLMGVTAFGEKIPVSVRVSTVKLFVDDTEINAYVIVAKNLEESKKLKESLENQQKKLTQLQNFVAFDQMMQDADMREAYKKFCKQEHCEENILFVEAVADYRKTRKTHERVLKQQQIVSMFLTKDSQYELNLSSQVMDSEVPLVKNGLGQLGLFDKLYDFVRSSMVVDSFQRFFKWFEENRDKLFRGSNDIKAEDIALLQQRLQNATPSGDYGKSSTLLSMMIAAADQSQQPKQRSSTILNKRQSQNSGQVAVTPSGNNANTSPSLSSIVITSSAANNSADSSVVTISVTPTE